MKLLVSGYGKMGKTIEKIILERGIEYAGWSEDICSTPKEIASDLVCIDFTTPDAFKANYKYIAENFGAAVIGTTGWNDIADEVKSYFESCGTTLIYASNFSIGVNVLFAATDYLSSLIAKFEGYKAKIEETHHIHKLDAPSGTAKSLSTIVDAQIGGNTEITSYREGEVPGIHTVTFEGSNDKISLTHEAFSREGFAAGAVEAALIAMSVKGVHEFKDIMFK